MAKQGTSAEKQIRFANEFVVDFNGTQAAIRAGYSERSATSTASKLLTYPKVQQAIQRCKDELAAKVGITAERTLKERGALAYADIRKLFDDEGCSIPPNLIPDDIAPAVSGVDIEEKFFTDKDGNTTRIVTYKYRTWDKNRALEALDKHFGLYNADNDQRCVSVGLVMNLKEEDD